LSIKDLLPFVETEREGEILSALIVENDSPTAAAKRLGCSRATVRGAVKRVRDRAEEESFARGDKVPFGQRLRGVSTLQDGTGATERAWVKTERDSDEPQEVQPVPEGFAISRVSTFVDGQNNVRARWISSDRSKEDKYEAFVAACRDVAATLSRTDEFIPVPPIVEDDWLNVFLFGDPHVGMLAHAAETHGDNHDLNIAVKDLKAAICVSSNSVPCAKRALLINLGDLFHAQDDMQRTPNGGNKLDVDERWHKVLRRTFEVLVFMVETLLRTHETVEIANVRGNHDPDSAILVPMFLSAWFRNEPRVIVRDNVCPYDSIVFGNNFIGLTHGDGKKREQLPGLFAAWWPQEWGKTKHRVCYSGHIHHETRKEFDGMTVETFRTLAPTDAWHAKKGYQAGRSMEVISHHVVYGPMRRVRVDIDQVRDHQKDNDASY
jgi:hypothetical protein